VSTSTSIERTRCQRVCGPHRRRRKQVDDRQKGRRSDHDRAQQHAGRVFLCLAQTQSGCCIAHDECFAECDGRHAYLGEGTGHILWSLLSWSTSPTNRTTVLLPGFCHQCAVPLVSGLMSPALCTIGSAQLLAYSMISPSAM